MVFASAAAFNSLCSPGLTKGSLAQSPRRLSQQAYLHTALYSSLAAWLSATRRGESLRKVSVQPLQNCKARSFRRASPWLHHSSYRTSPSCRCQLDHQADGMKPDIWLNLPAFLAGALILYWSLPLSILLGRIKPWKLFGKRDDAYGWALALQRWFGVTVLALPGPQLYKRSTCIYLCNHRSWADFYLDVLMTEGHAQMLSRWAVALVFPMFMVAVMNVRSVILFNRGKKFDDHEEFNRFIDRKIAGSPVPGLIVYPEGHRSTKRESLSLKKGMLHYIYSRKHMAQIIITANKEAVISEKELLSRFGQTILTGYSPVIDPRQYASFEEFLSRVQQEWNEQWKRVYGADWSDAGPLQPTTRLDDRTYSPQMKILSLVIAAPVFFFFVASFYYSWVGLGKLGRLLGSFQVPFFIALALWVAFSFKRAFKPVRLPTPLPNSRTATRPTSLANAH